MGDGLRGIEVSLATGKHLFAGYVPGRKSAALGIRDGGTLNVLAFFIGDAEFQAFSIQMDQAFGNGRLVISAGTEPSNMRQGDAHE